MRLSSSLFFICLLCMASLANGQKNRELFYQYPEKIPSHYLFDPLKRYNQVLKEDFGDLKERDREIFSEMVSFGEYDRVVMGDFYFGLERYENYLNDIAKTLLPDSVDPDEIRIHIGYNAEINANANHTGLIQINMGLLANVSSEAELATTIGHEISHYLNRDVKSQFILESTLKREGDRKEKKNLSAISARYSRSKESQADSIGILFCMNAGYDVRAGLQKYQLYLLEKMLYERSKYKYRELGTVTKDDEIHNPIGVLLSSHPDIQERIDKVNEMISDAKPEAGSEFLVNESLFRELQEMARKECLYIHYLENNNYQCLRNAFLFHLYEPQNEMYIYFALESLRRALYLNPGIATNGFLSDQYEEYFDEGVGILSDLAFMIPDSNKMKEIKTQSLLPGNKDYFDTYYEAILYFQNQALKNDIAEAYLSMALINRKNPELFMKFLNSYLEFEDVLYREYAEKLQKGEMMEDINQCNREVVIFAPLELLEKRSYGYHHRQMQIFQEEDFYIGSVRKYYSKKYPNKSFYSLSEYRKEDFHKFHQLRSVLITAGHFLFLAQKKEKMDARNEEIVEGVNSDGSETFVFDEDDYEEPDINTGKDKRKYKKHIKNSDIGFEESQNTIYNNREIGSDYLEVDNIFIYAPYCWNYFVEHDIAQVEFLQVYGYSNMTFSHAMKKLFTSSNEVSQFVELNAKTVRSTLKKGWQWEDYMKVDPNPSSVVSIISRYNKVEDRKQ